MDTNIFSDGKVFFSGCNYWASNAGTFMWRKWDPAAIERDFKQLSAHGVTVLRCFPLWPDFQPLTEHSKCGQVFEEYRMGEEPLPDTETGRAAVDPVMLDRFHHFAQLAQKYNLKLIVGLITGWMSGRMYIPTAFERRDLLTDPVVIQWQVRFVRCFVKNLKDEPAIVAWDWGNECNCLGDHTDAEMWLWGNTITAAIKLEDNSRPVVSGLHGSSRIHQAAMGEVADILCTHPYPAFTPHCRVDPLYSFRNAFHAAAETSYYADMGKKPAFVEEIGSFGPTYTSEALSSAYLRNAYWNVYAHSCHGALWWCANDQTELPQTPYDWVAMERELGLLRVDGSPKPALIEMKKFNDIVSENILPRHKIDATVILSQDTDCWGLAYMSFLLAKQAGFDIRTVWCRDLLPESDFYILPSIRNFCVMPKHRYLQLLEKIKAGATLLVTSDNAGLQPLEPTGIIIETLFNATTPATVKSRELDLDLTIPRTTHMMIRSVPGTELLACDETGAPAYCCARYGKGQILFLNAPLESSLLGTSGAFTANAPHYSRIYEIAAEKAGVKRIVKRSDRQITLTEHPIDDTRMAVVAVNNSTELRTTSLEIGAPWQVEKCINGTFADSTLTIAEKTGAILYLKK